MYVAYTLPTCTGFGKLVRSPCDFEVVTRSAPPRATVTSLPVTVATSTNLPSSTPATCSICLPASSASTVNSWRQPCQHGPAHRRQPGAQQGGPQCVGRAPGTPTV